MVNWSLKVIKNLILHTLKLNNAEWGIRDLRDLEAEASRSEITLEQVIDLPANNKLVIWKKE